MTTIVNSQPTALRFINNGFINPIADKRGLTHIAPFVPKEDTKMSDKIREAYEMEYSYGTVNVGSKCNRACFYCSQYWNPEDLVPNYNGYITLDEIKEFLKLVPNKHIKCAGAGITRVNMGEFFFHPQVQEILEYFRDENFFVHSYVTNGSLITEDNIKVIKEINENSKKSGAPSDHYMDHDPNEENSINLHITNYSQKMKKVLELLDKYEVPYFITLIANRREVDVGRVERWIKEIQKHEPIYIEMQLASWTKYASQEVIDKMAMSRAELNYLVEGWREKYPKHKIKFWMGLDNSAYITLSLNVFMKKYYEYIQKTNSRTYHTENVLFLCSKAVEDIFKPTIEIFKGAGHDFIKNYKVVPVENETFGGNVECAGLLLVDDYISTIEKTLTNDYKPDWIVTSSQSFTYGNVDLAGVSPTILSEKFDTNMIYC